MFLFWFAPSHSSCVTFYLQEKFEANQNDLLQPSEVDLALVHDTLAEDARQLKSFDARQRHAARLDATIKACPPTATELHGCAVCLDVNPPAELTLWLARRRACISRQMHTARVFITANPWAPDDDRLRWAARLLGGWIMAPDVYMGQATGPCLRFYPAFTTKRQLWVSSAFRAAFPSHWLLLLECLKMGTSKWALIGTAQEFARAKAHATAAKRSAEVLALLTADEATAQNMQKEHVFGPCEFLAFIEKKDDARSSTGLGNS